MTKIYHNPRCRKSRESLELLKSKGINVEIIEYLKEPPTETELRNILDLLKIPAESLIRKGEAIYKEKFKGKRITENQWIKAMLDYPKLIERPIVISEGKARIGRPPEKILEIL